MEEEMVSAAKDNNTDLATKENEEVTLPHNTDVERSLLANLLHDNRAFEYVGEFLQPPHFYHKAHGEIYKAMRSLIEQGNIVDPLILKDYLESKKILDEIGGWTYLVDLAKEARTAISSYDYGKKIYDLFLRRSLVFFSQDVQEDAYNFNLEESATHQIEKAEQKLFDLSTFGELDRGFHDFSGALSSAISSANTAFKSESHIVGVSTGFVDLDKSLGGLHPSDLLIVAGRPSMGKTAFATNIAFNAARQQLKEGDGAVVAFFSLEMSAEQLALRLLSQETNISSSNIRRGDLRPEDFESFTALSRELSSLPLFIDDTPALTISALRTRARRLKRQHNLGLIIVDYLQLLSLPKDQRRSNDGRVQEISAITRSLKAIAKELNVPVMALSQLSRAVEQRDDKRPQLSDLRESGSIEQDADVVMFVYRDEYYESRREPKDINSEAHTQWQATMERIHNHADIIIAKQRNGPIGTVKLFFDASLTKFGNLAPQY